MKIFFATISILGIFLMPFVADGYSGFRNSDGTYTLNGYVQAPGSSVFSSFDDDFADNKLVQINFVKLWVDTLGNEPLSSGFDSYDFFMCSGDPAQPDQVFAGNKAIYAFLDGRDGSVPYSGTLSDTSQGPFMCQNPEIDNTDSAAAIVYTVNYSIATSSLGSSSTAPIYTQDAGNLSFGLSLILTVLSLGLIGFFWNAMSNKSHI